MIIDEKDHLMHYGILRRSGRYPWGSGGNVPQRSRSFFDHINSLKEQGMSEPEIARGFGMSTTELRAMKSIAKNAIRQADIGMAQRLHEKGYSNVAIGKRMGIRESSVRSLLAPGVKDRVDVLHSTANMLKDQVEKKRFIDIGTGVENHVGVSTDKLATAVSMLKEEGYVVRKVQVDQLGTGAGKKTTVKVLAPPGTTYVDIVKNKDQINQITDFSEDGGRSYFGLLPPLSVSSKRVAVRYAEDGGTNADGIIYVRPGIKDVSLGKARYAQVRVAVDGTHYIKGMAVYKDDLPDGVDLMFNTNKSDTGYKKDAFKPLKDDPDNPFGSIVRQRIEKGLDGKDRVTSAMNIVNEEGNWESWSRNLSSQFLSKQTPKLAQTQLDMTYEKRRKDLDEIMNLTNPTVRRKLLETYAAGADTAAVVLHAHALPQTRNHAILPMNSLRDNEIYAPNYRNGTRVVLIRHPHAGPFEIPELVVNNGHPQARKRIGQAKDAVAINSKVAERLSGADFDGDTVLVIPNNRNLVKTAPALQGLKGFDARSSYPAYEGMKTMTPEQKAFAMGDVSNLITDMSIKRASSAELARAVRHSMVVIDAEKHNLNWKQSAIDNGITQLKTKYQGKSNAGASTLISRATSRQHVLDRKPRSPKKGGPVDPATGKKVFEETGDSWVDAKGRTVFRTQRSTKLAETDDAFTLSSGTLIEKVYATHSNKLKGLANEARKAAISTKPALHSPSAKKIYSDEVASLNAKLNIAIRNRPLERQAQLLANTVLAAKKNADPNMEAEDLKRVKFQALEEARTRMGAKKELIDITDAEWTAIQAGALSNNKLSQVLNNANLDRVKKLATPRVNTVMTSAKQRRAEAMLNSGYTVAEVADHLGVALSTLKESINREEG